jgi:hypothetical protein
MVGVNGACVAVIAGEAIRSVLLFLESGRIGAPRFAPEVIP